jgi:hypothetical protein
MSRHEQRQRLAREFGATDIVAERGDEGMARIKDADEGIGRCTCRTGIRCVVLRTLGRPSGRHLPGHHLLPGAPDPRTLALQAAVAPYNTELPGLWGKQKMRRDFDLNRTVEIMDYEVATIEVVEE